MSWTYMNVHFYINLPLIGILYLILRPYLHSYEKLKLVFTSIIAVIYTTPWDNYIIWRDAWTYNSDRIWFFVGWAPIEEYMFFVIQTAITLLFTILFSRWTIPSYHFNTNQTSYFLIRWVPISIFLYYAYVGYNIAIPATDSFYLGCILWWILPVMSFLWFGAGNYVTMRYPSTILSVLVPALFLCTLDKFAISEGIWHIEEKTTYRVFVVENLPVEEAFFFVIVNLVIVLANAAFDKSKAILELYPSVYKSDGGVASLLLNLLLAFLVQEPSLPKQELEDIQVCKKILSKKSKSFTVASYLFPSEIALDLTMLYSFCRVTDDMTDSEVELKIRRERLDIITKFLDELYLNRKPMPEKPYIDEEIDFNARPVIDWSFYEKKLTDKQIAGFRSFYRIHHFLPSGAIRELRDGYEWDINRKPCETEADLVQYSKYAASSVATLCVYVLLYRSGQLEKKLSQTQHWVIERARDMGVALQVVNIARDIITDGESLGRSYIPTEYMSNPETQLPLITEKRDPRALGNETLKQISTKLVNLAINYQENAKPGFIHLPAEVRKCFVALTRIYLDIGQVILSNPKYIKRSQASNTRKLMIGLSCMYFDEPSVKSLYAKIDKM